MKKKTLGSVTRTAIAFGAGIAISGAVDGFNLTAETLEQLLNSVEAGMAIFAVIVAQGWSLHEKMTTQKEIKNASGND